MSSETREREEANRRPAPAIFVGNVECQNDTKELTQLFEEFGEVSYVDAKKGFAFVVMPVRSEAERAIQSLKGKRFGPLSKELLVEWSRGNGALAFASPSSSDPACAFHRRLIQA